MTPLNLPDAISLSSLCLKQETPLLNATGFLGNLATFFLVGCKQPQICPLKLILAFTNSEGGDLVLKEKNLPRKGFNFAFIISPHGSLAGMALAPCKAGCRAITGPVPSRHSS
jgi:hypothetical protein